MLFLRNVKELYDGTSSAASSRHRHVDLVVEGGVIKDVMSHRTSIQPGAPDTVIDASDFVVTPGLIDCHNHVTQLGLAESDHDLMNGQTQLLWVEKILYTTLVDGGVTTTRDVGGATHLMKRLVDEGIVIGPRLKIAICMLSTTGGHADFRGPDRCHATISKLWPEQNGRPSSIVDGPWECRKRVREIAACGADLIKICASPGIASPTDHLEHRDFSPEEVTAICDEATARGLRVAAHAHSKNGINMAIESGVSDIQHISFMDERLVDAAATKGCTVTPTSWIIHALETAPGLSPFVMAKVRQAVEVHAKAVHHAVRGGLKILGGTDPVLPGMHGRNYMELAYLIKDGVTPLAAWHGMTGLAAAEIGQLDAGTLRVGQRADFLVARGNILDNPELLDQGALVEVFKDGVPYRGAFPDLAPRTFRTGLRERLAQRSEG